MVEFQIEFFYTMALDFLDGLKKKKRTVYPIVRDLLALVLRSGKVPGMMPDEIYEWLCPEEDAFDDEEDQKTFKRDREFALGRYEYHIRSVPCVNEDGVESSPQTGSRPLQAPSGENVDQRTEGLYPEPAQARLPL